MEEISLRDMIEILLKNKVIIGVITGAFIILALIYSFVVLSPAYEAETTLMISPAETDQLSNMDSDSIKGLVSALSQYPRMTIDTYREQVKAYDVLSYVRTQAGLEDMTLNTLSGKIDVSAVDKTNLLRITVKDNSPEEAAKLANLVSTRFTEFVSETNSRQAEASALFIKTELENEKINFDEISNELNQFLSEARGPEELKLELNSKMSQLTGFKTKLTSLQIDKEVKVEQLEKAKELLASTPEFIEVEKTLSSDQLMLGVYTDTTGSSAANSSALKLVDKQINAVYTQLTSTVNSLEISNTVINSEITNLQIAIQSSQEEIETLQSDLAAKQQIYDELSHQFSLSKQTYDAYQQKYKEATIMQAAEIGKQSIIIISQAVAPEGPVSPNKKLNIAIGMVLGLMLGVFIAFLKEYWISSSTEAA